MRALRMRTVAGGAIAGAALAIAAPAGLAFATPHDVSTPGDTVGRPTLGNPAPGVRIAQSIGDSTFDPQAGDGPLVKNARATLNASPIGGAYHAAFGTSGVITTTPAGVNIRP